MKCTNTQHCETIGFHNDLISCDASGDTTCGNALEACMLLSIKPEEKRVDLATDADKILIGVLSNRDTVVHGGYGLWSSWSICTRSCKGGTHYR